MGSSDMRKLGLLVAAAAVASLGMVAISTPAVAGEVVVTPGDVSISPGSWHPANERDGGMSTISGELDDVFGGGGVPSAKLASTRRIKSEI